MSSEQGLLLLVEDDEAIRAMLSRYLRSNGFEVVEAGDGKEAVATVAEQSFDLVLLDTLLPGLNGLEVLRSLRRTYSVTDLPVLMATALDHSADVVEALRLGANDYLAKPYDFSVVLARIQTQLSLKRSVEQISQLERRLELRNAELEAANAMLQQANARMRQDLEAAARVQQALLPQTPPELAGARFAWQLRPCTELAGDSLNVIVLDDRRIALYVLDVVGHGVKAALLAVTVSRVLTQLLGPGGMARASSARGPGSPVAVAERLNRAFPWDERTKQYFSLLYGVLDHSAGEFVFISAGHPGPIHVPRGGKPYCLDASGALIGLGPTKYKQSRVALGPGDRLYLYSDGIPEARNAGGEYFGQERFLSVLDEDRKLPLPDGLSHLVGQVEQWCSPLAPLDDLSILAMEIAAEASPRDAAPAST